MCAAGCAASGEVPPEQEVVPESRPRKGPFGKGRAVSVVGIGVALSDARAPAVSVTAMVNVVGTVVPGEVSR